MAWGTRGGEALPSASSRRRLRSRRRRHPLLLSVGALVAAAAIGWLWYYVFHPLFEDPKDFVGRQRAYRAAITEILTGSVGDAPPAPSLPPWPPPATPDTRAIVACAEAQVARGVRLSTRYHPMDYPWGDLPEHLAASPDVAIRCLRAVGLDLQQMIHQDRVRHPRRYPLHLWASTRPDKAIDHRRLANLYTFLKAFGDREGVSAEDPQRLAAFHPGDLVFWTTASGGEFPGLVGIVLDRRNAEGVPLVATLFPDDKVVTDAHHLTDWPITGHVHVLPERLLERFFEANPQVHLVPRPTASGGAR